MKCEEVEQTGSPMMNKSSPDDTSSDLVQEHVVSDDVVTTNGMVFESGCNSHMTSDVDDHSAGGTNIQV